jgi:hypothetical protein
LQGRLGFGNGSKENIDEFLQVVIEIYAFKRTCIELIFATRHCVISMNEISVKGHYLDDTS